MILSVLLYFQDVVTAAEFEAALSDLQRVARRHPSYVSTNDPGESVFEGSFVTRDSQRVIASSNQYTIPFKLPAKRWYEIVPRYEYFLPRAQAMANVSSLGMEALRSIALASIAPTCREPYSPWIVDETPNEAGGSGIGFLIGYKYKNVPIDSATASQITLDKWSGLPIGLSYRFEPSFQRTADPEFETIRISEEAGSAVAMQAAALVEPLRYPRILHSEFRFAIPVFQAGHHNMTPAHFRNAEQRKFMVFYTVCIEGMRGGRSCMQFIHVDATTGQLASVFTRSYQTLIGSSPKGPPKISETTWGLGRGKNWKSVGVLMPTDAPKGAATATVALTEPGGFVKFALWHPKERKLRMDGAWYSIKHEEAASDIDRLAKLKLPKLKSTSNKPG